jgi:hypothetical protein
MKPEPNSVCSQPRPNQEKACNSNSRTTRAQIWTATKPRHCTGRNRLARNKTGHFLFLPATRMRQLGLCLRTQERQLATMSRAKPADVPASKQTASAQQCTGAVFWVRHENETARYQVLLQHGNQIPGRPGCDLAVRLQSGQGAPAVVSHLAAT